MRLPLYQHPSLTVMIDDSRCFLASMAFQLDPGLACKTFHDTGVALDWLRKQHQVKRTAMPLEPRFDTNARSPDECNAAFNVDRIHQISYQAQRFMHPSVLVVDYSMPQMNGLEFFEALGDRPCKKILFTGVADEKVAVEAFNRGLIDRYIRKNEPDALERLETVIAALQQDYFASQSQATGELLALHQYSFVADDAVARLVDAIRREHGIVEHYLYPHPPGVLLYDGDAKARLLVIETEQGMRAHSEVARDNGAPPALIAALDERRVVPFFRDGDGMFSPWMAAQWGSHCRTAEVCQGAQPYYWALFELDPADLPHQPLPFAQFLREHRASH